MATVLHTKLAPGVGGEWDGVFRYQWTLAAGDDGSPVVLPRHADRSVQVTGVFDGGSLRIEGSLDNDTFAPVTDPQGNDIAITAYPAGYSSKIEAVSEATVAIRPRVVGGGGSTALTITVFCRS